MLQGCVKNIKSSNSLGHNTQDEPRVWIVIFTVMEKNAIAIVKENAGHSCSQHV